MSRAFGKIILAGEHAVVYGYPAIASTIDWQVRVVVRPSDRARLLFLKPRIESGHRSVQLCDQILPKLEQILGPVVRGLEFVIESNLPGGYGLGSSAALSVALIRASLDFLGESCSSQELANMALEVEKIFHGNPSGVDPTVISEEGLIWFERGKSQKIQSASPLKWRIMMSQPHAGTLAAVQAVRVRYDANPKQVTAIFESISELTHEMREALVEGDLRRVGSLMTLNHEFLRNLGVSTPDLDKLCHQAILDGAWGAKLTGAGGGGCVVALI